MRVAILGSGDAFGTGGRFATCLHVTAPGRAMLIDCGAGSIVPIQRAGIDPNSLDTVLITHFHGDHIGGLPGLLMDARHGSRRTTPLTIIGPPGIERRALAALEVAYPGAHAKGWAFELTFAELPAGAGLDLGATRLEAFPMLHAEEAGPCQGYRIAQGGRTLAFTGDSSWTEALVPLSAKADLLVTDCYTYDRPTMAHLDHQTLHAQRARLDAGRILLTHMGREMLDRPAAELAFDTAFDGWTMEL